MEKDTLRREVIRQDLEITRAAYHLLLDSLTDTDWTRRSANRSYTVGHLMSHLADDVGFMTRMVEWAKRGRSVNPPEWLFYLLNPVRVWWGARHAKRQDVGAKYDRGHDELCALLAVTRDDDWEREAVFLGRYTTVEGVFMLPVKHFAQHTEDIERGLGRVTSCIPAHQLSISLQPRRHVLQWPR